MLTQRKSGGSSKKEIVCGICLIVCISCAGSFNSHLFRTRDLRTGEPIAGALITVRYGDQLPGDIGHESWNDRVISGYTDEEGAVHLTLLDMESVDFLDWSDHAHFMCEKVNLEISRGEPLVKSVRCSADGYKVIGLEDGVRRWGKLYVGSTSETPNDAAKEENWGFISTRPRMTFWLARGESEAAPTGNEGSQARQAPSGTWSGTVYYTDRGVKSKYSLRVSFDDRSARSNAMAYTGKVNSVTPSDIVINWPQAGLERVSYSVDGGVLTARGTVTAYSDKRTLPSSWYLTVQPQ